MLEFTLKYCATCFVVLGLAFAGAHDNVEADDIAWGELILCDVVARHDPVDDHVVTVDDVSLHLV